MSPLAAAERTAIFFGPRSSLRRIHVAGFCCTSFWRFIPGCDHGFLKREPDFLTCVSVLDVICSLRLDKKSSRSTLGGGIKPTVGPFSKP